MSNPRDNTARVLPRGFFLSFCKTLVLAYVRADFLRQYFVQFNMRNIITPEALLVYPQILSLKTHRSVFSSVASAIFETFTVRVLPRGFFLSFCKTLVLAYVRADFLQQYFV